MPMARQMRIAVHMEGEMEIEPVAHHVGSMKADDAGRLNSRSATGGWTAAIFNMGVEIAERSAYFGVSSNLISYLTGPLGESMSSAATAVNVWSGVSSMLPLVGAFVADSYLGRYRTIVLASLLYLLGLGMLTLSSMPPTMNPSECTDFTACPRTQFQAGVFYFSLYVIAFAQGGHRPCVQTFGADQFDENNLEECKSKSSFFNWWNFGVHATSLVTTLALNYVQDNIGWTLGFGIPWIFMGVALTIFLLGTRFYRCHLIEDKNPFAKIWKACATLINSWQRTSIFATSTNGSTEALLPHASDRTKHSGYSQHESIDDAGQEEEAKGLLQLFPIWAACLTSAAVLGQSTTLFTKQASTLDRRIGTSFQVPPAALQSFVRISLIAFIPVYDRVIVPMARNFTGLPTGITMLQRIGTGLFLSVIMMVAAALIEMKRLETARDFGLVDMPDVAIPMSMWWLLPPYVLDGIMFVLTFVGLQEFFYGQVREEMRSLGLAFYSSVLGAGELLSGFLVSVIDKVTGSRGESWFSDNLNHAHLDYFYWLLAGLSSIQLGLFLCFAQSYVYKKKVPTAL
ncbi:protein NRT1/ PTR FAMILY 5.10-like [Phoenix dactylifera]|uniref:Protein NRT1/ PTR FAMILY 5.10-like n=1 Tax=Phoenix dactylifera TaxID=42345 RepID=A0A8B7MSY8_PHODC|nr:protein NRT1/ PTR FAMILY 5.10-like [Phoenix dactylifera]